MTPLTEADFERVIPAEWAEPALLLHRAIYQWWFAWNRIDDPLGISHTIASLAACYALMADIRRDLGVEPK